MDSDDERDSDGGKAFTGACRPCYNNCFTLGAKSKRDNGAIIKVPAFIDSDGYPAKLWGGKGGALSRYYSLS